MGCQICENSLEFCFKFPKPNKLFIIQFIFSINSLVDLLQARGPQLVYDPVRLHLSPLEDVGLGVLQGREHPLGVELPLVLDLDLASLSLSSCLATLS